MSYSTDCNWLNKRYELIGDYTFNRTNNPLINLTGINIIDTTFTIFDLATSDSSGTDWTADWNITSNNYKSTSNTSDTIGLKISTEWLRDNLANLDGKKNPAYKYFLLDQYTYFDISGADLSYNNKFMAEFDEIGGISNKWDDNRQAFYNMLTKLPPIPTTYKDGNIDRNSIWLNYDPKFINGKGPDWDTFLKNTAIDESSILPAFATGYTYSHINTSNVITINVKDIGYKIGEAFYEPVTTNKINKNSCINEPNNALAGLYPLYLFDKDISFGILDTTFCTKDILTNTDCNGTDILQKLTILQSYSKFLYHSQGTDGKIGQIFAELMDNVSMAYYFAKLAITIAVAYESTIHDDLLDVIYDMPNPINDSTGKLNPRRSKYRITSGAIGVLGYKQSLVGNGESWIEEIIIKIWNRVNPTDGVNGILFQADLSDTTLFDGIDEYLPDKKWSLICFYTIFLRAVFFREYPGYWTSSITHTADLDNSPGDSYFIEITDYLAKTMLTYDNTVTNPSDNIYGVNEFDKAAYELWRDKILQITRGYDNLPIYLNVMRVFNKTSVAIKWFKEIYILINSIYFLDERYNKHYWNKGSYELGTINPDGEYGAWKPSDDGYIGVLQDSEPRYLDLKYYEHTDNGISDQYWEYRYTCNNKKDDVWYGVVWRPKYYYRSENKIPHVLSLKKMARLHGMMMVLLNSGDNTPCLTGETAMSNNTLDPSYNYSLWNSTINYGDYIGYNNINRKITADDLSNNIHDIKKDLEYCGLTSNFIQPVYYNVVRLATILEMNREIEPTISVVEPPPPPPVPPVPWQPNTTGKKRTKCTQAKQWKLIQYAAGEETTYEYVLTCPIRPFYTPDWSGTSGSVSTKSNAMRRTAALRNALKHF